MRKKYQKLIVAMTFLVMLGIVGLNAQNNPGNFPLYEGFEGESYAGIPLDWHKLLIGFGAYFLARHPVPMPDLADNYAMRYFGGPFTVGQNGYLHTPLMNLQTFGLESPIILSFDIKLICTSDSWTNTFRVFIPTDEYWENGITLATVVLTENWQNVEVDLSEFQGQEIRLSFHASQSTSLAPEHGTTSSIFIDNISVTPVNVNPSKISTFPYFESFEQNVDIAPGWSYISTNGENNWMRISLTDENNQYLARTGNYTVASRHLPGFSLESKLVTPQFSIPQTSETFFSFHVKSLSDMHANDKYTVFISTSNLEAESFVEIFSETITNESNDWLERTIDLSEYRGQDVYLAFKHLESLNSDYLLIDDFYFVSKPVLFLPPSNLEAVGGYTEIELAWTSPSSECIGTLIGYRMYRNDSPLPETIPAEATTFMDTDLESGTEYTYYLRALYENPDGESTPSNTVTATTISSPNFTINPISHIFDPTFVGETSLPQDFVITNTMGNTLIISSVLITGVDASEFKITHPDLPISIGVTERMSISVRFEPASTGFKSASIVFYHNAGESSTSVEVSGDATVSESDVIFVDTELLGNYPNPFNPTTFIKFNNTKESRISVEIFDIKGRKVKTLTDQIFAAGSNSIEWDGRNSAGQAVGSGIYFYRMTAGNVVETKRMVLLK